MLYDGVKRERPRTTQKKGARVSSNGLERKVEVINT